MDTKLVARKIVRALSGNSRISISDLSRSMGVSRLTLRNRMKRIETELGMHYTSELDERMLGLANPHLIVVKFDSKPDLQHIEELLRRSSVPQLAVSIKGGYDLMIYAVATTTSDYVYWDKAMQILLSRYGIDWRSSEVVHRQLGFIPLRNELLDKLNMQKEAKEMLKMLNLNARVSLRQMALQLKMHFNTAAYNFNKLLKAGYVRRFTVTMNKPNDVTLMSFIDKYKPREGHENIGELSRRAYKSDDEYSIISRYILCAQMIGSYDFFALGVFDNQRTAYRNCVLYHKNLYKREGINQLYGTVDRVLLGRLPIRSIDTKKEYNTIVWDANLQKI